MNESIRTIIFVGLAAIAGLAAWNSRRSSEPVNGPVQTGPLFPDFKDPLEAKSLEIVTFDETTAAMDPFKVAQVNGRWVISSNGDYPADAENQMRDAAAGLIDLESLAVASEISGDHKLYRVVEPDRSKLSIGDQGVGTLVAVQDAKGNDLMRLVVGDQVAGAPDQRFVRKPSEEVVYVAKINLDKLSTDFDKWIEKDLLKISPFDVAKVTLKDYSLLPTSDGGVAYLPRMDATLSYASDKGDWSLDKMIVFGRNNEPKEAPLSEQEELNKQKLDDLRNALDELKIVDVAKKPEALGKILKEGLEGAQASELAALQDLGFIPARGPDGKFDVFASSGEAIVDMKDGVRYVLRFGKVSGTQNLSTAAKKTAGDKPEDDDGGIKVNRYLFVSALLSPLTLTQPVLEAEPAGPETPAEKPAGEAGDKPADAAEKPAAGAKAEDPADPTGEKPAAAPADPAKAERERIKRENDKKLAEYREKRVKAENRVKELNGRFADWYYVVSEDVYKKLRLSRSDFVKESATATEAGFGVDAFRKLEQGGLEGVAAPTTTPAPMFPGGGLPPGFPPMP